MEVSRSLREAIHQKKTTSSLRKSFGLEEGIHGIAENRKIKRKLKKKVKSSGWIAVKQVNKWEYDIPRVPADLQATVLDVSPGRTSLLSTFQYYFSNLFLETLLKQREEEIVSN